MLRKLRFDEPGPKLNETDVRTFEKWLGVSLPDAFRAYLLTYNGGSVNEDFRQVNGPITLVISLLHSLNEDPDHPLKMDLKTDNETSWKQKRISRDVLKFGFDQGGGYFLLAIRGEHQGSVWFYRWDTDDGPKRGDWSKRSVFRRIADDFEAFLEMLGPIKP